MADRERIIKDLIQDEYFHKLIIDPDEECTEFWRQWENNDPKRKYCINEAKKFILSAKFRDHKLPGNKKSQIWESISSQIDAKPMEPFVKQRKLLKYIGYGIAASIALLLIATFSITSNFYGSQESTTNEIGHIEKEAPKGKISSIKFEDGTLVKLFSGTKIIYPEKFNNKTREVYIEGEAFFNVAKDEARPFVVKTNSLITTAIGTSFNVRTYEGHNNCNVSLVEGKVKVEKLNKSVKTLNEIILEPGEEASLKDGGIVKQAFSIQEKVAWKDGYIYLHDKSFEESVEILERWFLVEFEVIGQYKSKGKKGTGKFRNQNLKNILNVMGHSFDFTFEITEDKVYVQFK